MDDWSKRTLKKLERDRESLPSFRKTLRYDLPRIHLLAAGDSVQFSVVLLAELLFLLEFLRLQVILQFGFRLLPFLRYR